MVDDNLMNLKVFVSLLKPNRVNVDVVDSGKSCLEMIERKHYDLIFLDHMMPEMDGIETLHRMKTLPENKCQESAIVALTANAITGAKEMYLSEGFDAFLPKPINPEKLEQIMERRRMENTIQDIDIPMVEGIDWSYGLMHLPGKEMLLSSVTDFYKTLMVEADTLDGFYLESKNSSDMLTQYRIKVHAMKSSANLIEATEQTKQDIDVMDEVMQQLERFQYSSPMQEHMERLAVWVTNMDNEQADVLIEELINQIKWREEA